MFKNLSLATIKTALLGLAPLLAIKLTSPGGVPTFSLPNLAETFAHWQTIAVTALYYYELVVRLVPSVENNSVVHYVGLVLNWLVPNHAVRAYDGGLGTHEVDEFVVPVPGAGPGPGLGII